VTDTPLTAENRANWLKKHVKIRATQDHNLIECAFCREPWPCMTIDYIAAKDAIAALTERAERAEARVAELTAALTEQGLLQKKADGSMVWHVHDCPASFDFAQCNYRCRVARAALEGKR